MTDTELNEKLNNDFKAFRMEHDNRISQKYVVKEAGKGLSEENFTPQEKNKLASLTDGADIDTSQFATKDELQTALSNVTVDTSALATKAELQTATRNAAHYPLYAVDVYVDSYDYNTMLKKFNVPSVSENVNLTRFLKILVLKLTTGADDLTTKYTAEDIYNAALNISQASRALIDDDLYVPQEDLANYIEDVSTLENALLSMQSSISENFITTASFSGFNSDLYYTDKAITIKMADVFLQYLKANNIVPTIMYYTDGRTTYKITDDNLAWFNVIANGSFEKLTANNLADATELYACCRQVSELANSDYISPDISVEGDFSGATLFAVV